MKTIQELILMIGGSSAFAKRFKIGLRTVQYWRSGKQKPPEWVLLLFNKVIDNCE